MIFLHSRRMIPHMPYPRRGQVFLPRPATTGQPAVEAELHAQLEEILDAVWKAEADWRFNDRLDLALKRSR
jgi:hypothetical protein